MRKKQLILICESASGKGFIVPEKYMAYFLLINEGCRFPKIKNFFIRSILTVAERIAEW